ncbi:GyrI-like domain-containing protein [Emticicia sp. BO119]|uniref:GyrI-like domain-containing protein n=1 Tax=Emticicia sp. BO119 TaxID=2757768 RepID=UPI0015F09D79|nr:GyrI-like domain-containing protein [Emticicia sp. BO119]MBA4852993.1 GyrI-like domain-containing protein [Emticicia sp. BO119]
MLQPRIETLQEKKLIGKRLKMSFADNKTGELWRSFMLNRKAIINTASIDLYSLQLYALDFFNPFNPHAAFEKWAAVEVADFDHIPDGMEAFTLNSGLYAVFLHKGSSTDNSTFQYIFSTWLPNSEYVLDDRPHFELLGDKYKNADADSEEEIWVPIVRKS